MRRLLLLVAGTLACTDPRGNYTTVPAGTSWLGCVAGDTLCDLNERPGKEDTLVAFEISRTEVAVKDWKLFVRVTGYRSEAESTGRGRAFNSAADEWQWIDGLSWATPLRAGDSAPDDWPVVQVSATDAEQFCRWTGGRLPTEREWEHAARAGTPTTIYLWGNTLPPIREGQPQENGPDSLTRLSYPTWATFPGYFDGYATLAPVTAFPATPLGISGLAGNAYEWTSTPYDSLAYSLPPDPQRVDPVTRVVRGGSWGYAPEHHRISFRGYFEARDFWTATLGFRCARDLK